MPLARVLDHLRAPHRAVLRGLHGAGRGAEEGGQGPAESAHHQQLYFISAREYLDNVPRAAAPDCDALDI